MSKLYTEKELHLALLSEREKIYKELLAIADAGEYEDMRREVSLLFETTKSQYDPNK